jgi:hypothetical protein
MWSLNALLVTGTVRLSAKTGVPVFIQSAPERIKVYVNSKPWPASDNESGWIQTPTTIYLPEGQHKMQVERPGYVPHQFKILATPGDSIQVKPELETQIETFVETSIVAEAEEFQNLTLIVDSGLAVGNPPLEIDDLTPGNHALELRWGGLDGLRKKPFRCIFTAAINGGNNTLKITISRVGKKLKINGCKRI